MHRKISLFLAPLAVATTLALAETEKPVVRLQVDGIITPATANYIRTGIRRAEIRNAAAVLIEINSSGGLWEASREIAVAILKTDCPVIVHVAPSGASCTGIGFLTLLAADIVAMSPHTRVGGDHLIVEDPKTPTQHIRAADLLKERIISEAVNYASGLAAARGRNVGWTERVIREGVSFDDNEAYGKNAVEYVTSSAEELFRQIDGRTITKNQKTTRLEVLNHSIVDLPISNEMELFSGLFTPRIAFLLLTIGVFGFMYTLVSPHGMGVGGFASILCFLAALYPLFYLPVNLIGVAMMLAGALLLLGELSLPTYGLLAYAGLIVYAMGAVRMIDYFPLLNVPAVPFSFIFPIMIVAGLFFFFVVQRIHTLQRTRPRTKVSRMIGEIGLVTERLSPRGVINVKGEFWKARGNSSVEVGEEVLIDRAEDQLLIVRKIPKIN